MIEEEAQPTATTSNIPETIDITHQTNDESLEEWLAKRGLDKYAHCFKQAGADITLLPCLTEEDLRQMGIATIGARKKILLGASQMIQQQQHIGNKHGDQSMDLSLTTERPFSILQYFSKPSTSTANTPSITPFPLGNISNKQNNNNNKWVHADQKSTTTTNRKQNNNSKAFYPFMSWQLIPGTTFVVDRFNSLPPTASNYRHWFLTHFHSDHYKGLSSKFSHGTVYCTPITAALVKLQLKVKPQTIREVNIGDTITIDGVHITFLPANHCPGAAMLLFQLPDRFPLLHTGDCRLSNALIQNLPQIEPFRGAIDLVLDTTYCNPEYTFPPQEEALQFVIDAVKAEAFNQKTLFLFGSYTIGKEKVYLEAAKALNKKIYVSATKKKVLDCLQFPPEEASLLTTNDYETNLHVVPLWMVSKKHMAKTYKYYRGQYTNIIGFRPTGWSHQRDKNATKPRGKRKTTCTLIVYGVPYSEHSSFDELCRFVEWLKPKRIIPHVNSDNNGPKSQALVSLLLQHSNTDDDDVQN